MDTNEITKKRHPCHDLPQACGEENTYVRFGYGSLKICNRTQGQVSGSMNADPINMIHTGQKPKKSLEQRT